MEVLPGCVARELAALWYRKAAGLRCRWVRVTRRKFTSPLSVAQRARGIIDGQRPLTVPVTWVQHGEGRY